MRLRTARLECSAPNLSTCIARQARVAKADRHPYQPRERTTTT